MSHHCSALVQQLIILIINKLLITSLWTERKGFIYFMLIDFHAFWGCHFVDQGDGRAPRNLHGNELIHLGAIERIVNSCLGILILITQVEIIDIYMMHRRKLH